MIKIAIAEDNDFLARAISDKLNLFADEINYKYRAVNGAELLVKLEEDANLDVILMDIEMPEMNGISATELVKKKYPHIAIIMLTVFDDEENIFQSILAGANGYLLKDEPASRIKSGITEIMEGGAPMSPTIAIKALKLLRSPNPTAVKSEEHDLSKRQVEILEQLCTGLGYQQIAANLIISPGTVRKHIENIYKKLQVHNKVEAIKIATQKGIV